jgi:hypothetical protein
VSARDPRERVKRPEPERTQPIRNWGVLFGAPGTSPPQTPRGEPVSRGVEAGYRVVEEYLRQGQNVARSVGLPYLGGGPAEEGLQNRLGAMLRSFSDFAGLWMELMGKGGFGTPGAAAPGVVPPSGTAGPFPASGEPGAAEVPKGGGARAPVASTSPGASESQTAASWGLTFDIESARRIEVAVDLRPRSSGLALKVHELRAPEPDKPRLAGVTIVGLPDEERVSIRIQVPDDHPPGIYSGIILDERTSLPRGTLSVRIPAP